LVRVEDDGETLPDAVRSLSRSLHRGPTRAVARELS
jgi:hypothetical protein